MISTNTTIIINEHKKENMDRNNSFFPCSAFISDIHHYDSNYLPAHWHREMEMFVLDEGFVRITSVNQEFLLHPGEAYFANSNTLHGITALTDKPCRFHSLVFDSSIIAGAPGSAFDLLYVQPFITHGTSILKLIPNEGPTENVVFNYFETAFTACANEPEGHEFIVRDALSHLLLSLKNQQKLTAASQLSEKELRIKKILSWIELHYSETITIAQLASAAGISVRECQRLFSNVLHTTPILYLMNYRLTVAARLLKGTDYSIGDIAERCGFESPSYFSKQFKQVIGKTPRQYRKL